MSAMAEVMLHKGHTVTGSDLAETSVTQRLASVGVQVQYGHTPDLVKQAELVVYTSAVRQNNDELIYARQHGIPCVRRAEALGELMKSRFNIGVAGTHGKTSTTSMIGCVLKAAGRNPTVVMGGTQRDTGSNAVVGTGDLFVAEADEYDRSFLAMRPTIAVVTNVESEHLDIYGTYDKVQDAFVQFANSVSEDGCVVIGCDDPGALRVSERVAGKIVTFGLVATADCCATDIQLEQHGVRFGVQWHGKALGEVRMSLQGRHNVSNALAAVAVALQLGVRFDDICGALADFPGVKRRLEILGRAGGITVVDDYAHHPTEIRASLEALNTGTYARVVAVFQPHLYSRTRDFLDGFAASLTGADVVLITSIYKAREEPIPGVRAEDIVRRMESAGHKNTVFVRNMQDIPGTLTPMLRDGDCVVCLGAGDIWKTAHALLKGLRHAEA